MSRRTNPKALPVKEVALDEKTTKYILEVDDAERQAVQQAIDQAARPFRLERQTILQHTLRLRGLEGSWSLSPDRSKLVAE